MRPLIFLIAFPIFLCACQKQAEKLIEVPAQHESCGNIPRPANAELPLFSSPDDWYQVYDAGPGVYALVEPFQFQEAISYLIIGDRKALLFDSGIGLVPIRPVVETLTNLPVEVLNSHTHYDHVGGNYEFQTILALDTPYTRANMAGFGHEELSGEVAAEAFCKGAPTGINLSTFRTRPWTATRFIHDAEILELGGRTLEILQVPGHTPDSLALFDSENGLLWTGDTYYDGPLWLFVPETDLGAYSESMKKLTDYAGRARFLLPAHNTARVSPDRIQSAANAVLKMRSGLIDGALDSAKRLVFEIDGVTILTAQPLLDGVDVDVSSGGSGLTTWAQ